MMSAAFSGGKEFSYEILELPVVFELIIYCFRWVYKILCYCYEGITLCYYCGNSIDIFFVSTKVRNTEDVGPIPFSQ